MKTKHIFTAFLLSLLFIFTSCSDAIDFINSLFDDPCTESDLTYSSSDYAWNLGDSTSITLSGVNGKEIFFVNYNNTSHSNPGGRTSAYTIPAYSTRILAGASGLSYSHSYYPRLVSDCSDESHFDEEFEGPFIKNFEAPVDYASLLKKNNMSRSISSPSVNASLVSKASVLNKYGIGAKKDIYVDSDVNLNNFIKKEAELCAIGYGSGTSSSYNFGLSGNDSDAICLVWVVSDCLDSSSSSGKKVTKTLAEDVAKKFAKLYYHERDVFGEEFNGLITGSSTSTANINSNISGDTGTLVNIVIYDIGNDYGMSSQCGVVGYFYAKDYYDTNLVSYSNEGKYFYLDSAFCNLSGISGSNYQYNGNNNSASDTAITTIYHEFQHMIDFNQKEIESNGSVSSEHWYNEMLSMLAEDMMASGLGISPDDAPWGARFPGFNKYYYYSGIDEYRESGYSVISYSTAYTFGAWLARKYGGVSFVSTVSKDHSDGGIRSLINASGTSYNSRQLFKLFIKDIVQNTDGFPSSPNSKTSYGFISRMEAVNIYDPSYSIGSGYNGPVLFGPQKKVELRPHGFAIHYAGRAESDTVTLNFTGREYNSEDVMIYAR